MSANPEVIKDDFLRRLRLIEQGHEMKLVDLHVVYTLPGQLLKQGGGYFLFNIRTEDVLKVRLAVSHAAAASGIESVEVIVVQKPGVEFI